MVLASQEHDLGPHGLGQVLRRGNGMGAAELIMRARARTVVCVGDVVEVLTLLDQTAAAVRGTA
jgi:hypothetical protein